MADERDNENEPRIRVVDRRMLNEDEREGRAEAPKLEIIGGGRSAEPEVPEPPAEMAADTTYAAGESLPSQDLAEGFEEGAEEGEELTEEEEEQLRSELENEQFAAIEGQMGRPLTAQEKDVVRAEMARQAQSMAALEIPPMLQQMMAELSARAAVHMGLMPNPYTRLIARNDAQARMAIDAFGALYDIIKLHLDPASQREFARVLNDLRVNYASITGASLGGPSRIIH